MKEIIVMLFSNVTTGINPIRSFLIGILSLVFGITIKDVSGIMEIIAFGVSIIAGILTAIHIYHKIIDRRDRKRLKNKQDESNSKNFNQQAD